MAKMHFTHDRTQQRDGSNLIQMSVKTKWQIFQVTMKKNHVQTKQKRKDGRSKEQIDRILKHWFWAFHTPWQAWTLQFSTTDTQWVVKIISARTSSRHGPLSVSRHGLLDCKSSRTCAQVSGSAWGNRFVFPCENAKRPGSSWQETSFFQYEIFTHQSFVDKNFRAHLFQ